MVDELDVKAFSNVCRQKFPKDDAEAERINLCSKWQNEISNSDWHPFIVAMVNEKDSVLGHYRKLNTPSEIHVIQCCNEVMVVSMMSIALIFFHVSRLFELVSRFQPWKGLFRS